MFRFRDFVNSLVVASSSDFILALIKAQIHMKRAIVRFVIDDLQNAPPRYKKVKEIIEFINYVVMYVLEWLFWGFWYIINMLAVDWISEFANNYRRLCTTMPWNIPPSLLVIWGVCWMFYDNGKTPHEDAFWHNSFAGENTLTIATTIWHR